MAPDHRCRRRFAASRRGFRGRMRADGATRRAVKSRPAPSTLAVYGYWRGASLANTRRVSKPAADSWYWGVPLPDGTYNTLVFVDPAWFRSAPGSTISERFLGLIDRSGLMEGCRDVELIAPVCALDATAYLGNDCVAPTRIQLGDAGLAHRSDFLKRCSEGDPERTLRRHRRQHPAAPARVDGRCSWVLPRAAKRRVRTTSPLGGGALSPGRRCV